MSDEYKLNRDTGRGLQAGQILENEMITEAFTQLEQEYIKAWRATHIDDAAGREKLFLAVNIVGKVRDHLQVVFNNGKLAAAELRQIAEMAQRKPGWHEVIQ